MKRNRFLKVTGKERTLNEELVQQPRGLAGFKVYTRQPAAPGRYRPEFVIGAYHQRWQVEKSFPMN